MAGYSFSDFSSTLTVHKKTDGAWDYERLDEDASRFEQMAVPVVVSVIMGEFLDETQITNYGGTLLKHNILHAPSTVFVGVFGQQKAMNYMAESMTSLPPEWAAYQGGIFIERARVNKQLRDGTMIPVVLRAELRVVRGPGGVSRH